jgi:hypothetical protein
MSEILSMNISEFLLRIDLSLTYKHMELSSTLKDLNLAMEPNLLLNRIYPKFWNV